MTIFFAVDASPTMHLTVHGTLPNDFNHSKFNISADIIQHIISRCFVGSKHTRDFILLAVCGGSFRCTNIVTPTDLPVRMLKAITPKVDEPANLGQFVENVGQAFDIHADDKLIIFTDCSTFKGDLNFFNACETRFVILNHRSTLDDLQLEEITEIAAQSMGVTPDEENEWLYSHFFAYDYLTRSAVVEALVEEFVDLNVYELRVGSKYAPVKVSHSFLRPDVTYIEVLGHCASHLLESDDTHDVFPFCHGEDSIVATPPDTPPPALNEELDQEDDDGQPEQAPVLHATADSVTASAPLLIQAIINGLDANLSLVVRLSNGEHGYLSTMANSEDDRILTISLLPKEKPLPHMMPVTTLSFLFGNSSRHDGEPSTSQGRRRFPAAGEMDRTYGYPFRTHKRGGDNKECDVKKSRIYNN